MKDGENNLRCTGIAETEVSIDSKIVLKCWLEERLENTEIFTHVPIHAIDNMERKFEFDLGDKQYDFTCVQKGNYQFLN